MSDGTSDQSLQTQKAVSWTLAIVIGLALVVAVDPGTLLVEYVFSSWGAAAGEPSWLTRSLLRGGSLLFSGALVYVLGHATLKGSKTVVYVAHEVYGRV